MASHWVVFPTADPVRGNACASRWRAKGYDVLIGADEDKDLLVDIYYYVYQCALPFAGYYRVINEMVATAFARYDAALVTCIGDDMMPPSEGATAHTDAYFLTFPKGDGVMQCCGDPQGTDETGRPAAARICGSPTFGHGWWKAGYGGRGPFCARYKSFWADEDLWNVAKRQDKLWLASDFMIDHAHWSWGRMPRQAYHERAELNWNEDKRIFDERKARGFPDEW